MNLKDKRVCITGADGFIGSHLTELLLPHCSHVRALVQYNSFNSWGWLDHSPHKNEIEIYAGDIRDSEYCNILATNIDIIFHLAALIAIPFSYEAIHSYVDTNIKGTLNICQAALKNNCQRIIHTSTSEVYGTALQVPIGETHPLQPQSPYSATKIGADAIAKSIFHSFDLPLIIARPFNTYGPRQSARAVIPTIISQIAVGKKTITLGDTNPTRDFNYVKDTCNGLIGISQSENILGETINIGSNSEISILELVKTIKDLMQADDVEIITEQSRIRPKNSEVNRLVCDNTKIREKTRFKPQYSLEQGLSETIKWFSDPDNLSQYKTNIYNK